MSRRGRSFTYAGVAVARVVAELVRVLPVETAVRILDRVERSGELDYARATVRLMFDSVTAFDRRNACRKEPETIQWIERSMRAGDVMYDIGANIGAYSLVAATVSRGQCTVYAVEPSFSTFATLCRNVLINRCEEAVVPLQLALADETGLQTIEYSRVSSGATTHLRGAVRDTGSGGAAAGRQSTACFRLDDLIRCLGLRLPNLMKVDVDGAEERVLLGAPQALQSPGLRSLLIEIDEREVQAQGLMKLLEDAGFRLSERHPRHTAGIFNCIFAR